MADKVSAAAWLEAIQESSVKAVVIEDEGQEIEFHIRKLWVSEFMRIFGGLFAKVDALEEKDTENVVDVEAIRAKMLTKETDWTDQLGMIRQVVLLCTVKGDWETLPREPLFTEETIDAVKLPIIAKLGREILAFSGFNQEEAELARSFREEPESS